MSFTLISQSYQSDSDSDKENEQIHADDAAAAMNKKSTANPSPSKIMQVPEAPNSLEVVLPYAISSSQLKNPPLLYRCPFCMIGFQDGKGLLQHLPIHKLGKPPKNNKVDEDSNSNQSVPNVDELSNAQDTSDSTAPPLPTCIFMRNPSDDILMNGIRNQTLISPNRNSATDKETPQQQETPKSKGSKRNKRKSTGGHHINNNNKRHVCVMCSKRFQRTLNLLEHIQTHTGERYYECPKCCKEFLRERDRQRHVDHSQVCGVSQAHHVCPACSKVFTGSGYLERHIRNATCKKSLKCPTCSIKFSRSSTLNQHVRNGTCKTSHECPTCSKVFLRSSILERHVRNDVCKKALECPLCSKKFARRENLLNHIKRHAGETAHACKKCSKEFLKKSDLKRHSSRSHSRGPI